MFIKSSQVLHDVGWKVIHTDDDGVDWGKCGKCVITTVVTTTNIVAFNENVKQRF